VTLRRLFNWTIGLPVAVVAIAFCVANRESITVSFDPIHHDQPWASLAMPLWVLFFSGIFVGLIAGWISAWLNQGRWRKAAREHRAELLRREAELARLARQSGARVPVRTP